MMDYHNKELSFLDFKRVPVKTYIKCLKIAFFLAYSADPDKMPPFAALHLGFHCLLKYLLTGIQNEINFR